MSLSQLGNAFTQPVHIDIFSLVRVHDIAEQGAPIGAALRRYHGDVDPAGIGTLGGIVALADNLVVG